MTKQLIPTAIIACLLTLSVSQAQQATSGATQPQQAAVPCTTSATPAGPQQQVQLSTNAKKFLSQKQAWLQKFSPVTLPDATKIPAPTKQVAPPCQPAVTPISQLVPAVHLPAGISTLWLCNPVVTGTDHSTSYIMPSDITEASPVQPGTFLADSVKADAHGLVSCSNLHRDPASTKYWLANSK